MKEPLLCSENPLSQIKSSDDAEGGGEIAAAAGEGIDQTFGMFEGFQAFLLPA